jgi:4-hydroxy-tetrahydrodipicolinate synthase
MTTLWRGVFAIPPTPFTPDGALDLDGLRSCVAFCLRAGVHGLVAPVNASESLYLSDAERERVVATVLETVDHRLPVVIGVTTSCTRLTVAAARQAEQAGADAVIAMPPFVQRAEPGEIRDFFAALDGAVGIPVFLQNYGGPGGTPMSVGLILELIEELEHVHFLKEETENSGPTMTAVLRGGGPKLRGVMGGKAGRHLLDEYRRGICGTMPACEVADVHVRLWNALEAGRTEEARSIYERVLPLLLFESVHGVIVYKEVLRRRGVIGCAGYRQSGAKRLDVHASAELTELLRVLQPLLLNHDGAPPARP